MSIFDILKTFSFFFFIHLATPSFSESHVEVFLGINKYVAMWRKWEKVSCSRTNSVHRGM